MLRYAVAMLFLFPAIPAAQAQSGGYRIYTPPAIGSGQVTGTATYVNPTLGGGYQVYTPPQIGSGQVTGTTTYVTPQAGGGYRAYTPPAIGSGQVTGTTTYIPINPARVLDPTQQITAQFASIDNEATT